MVARRTDGPGLPEPSHRILYMSEQVSFRPLTASPLRRVAGGSSRALARRGRTEADWLRSRRGRADLAVFHEFAPPPYGGGNQFLLALVGELGRRGLAVELNRLSGGTPALPLQLLQLRLRAAEAVRARRRAHGASRRRADRRLSRLRRRHRPADRRDQPRARRRDDPAVALQPRQASRARARRCAIPS